MKILIIDTETTGLQAPQACEIAYFNLEGSVSEHRDKAKIYSNFNSLIELDDYFYNQFQNSIFNSRFRPNKAIDINASKVTGIYMKDVITKPNVNTFELPEIDCIMGHNVKFDLDVLNNSQSCDKSKINPKLICTKELMQLTFPKGNGLKSHKLTSSVEWLYPQIGDQLILNAHGALQDCKLVYLVILKILEKFTKVTEWEELVKLCSQGKKTYEQMNEELPDVKIMPFGKYRGTEIKYLPIDYVDWLLNNTELAPPLEAALKRAKVTM